MLRIITNCQFDLLSAMRTSLKASRQCYKENADDRTLLTTLQYRFVADHCDGWTLIFGGTTSQPENSRPAEKTCFTVRRYIARYNYAIVRCLSVCLSVTCCLSIKTAKRIITHITPLGSLRTLDF